MTSHPTFSGLPTFLNDARALASPNLTLILVGNKLDLAEQNQTPLIDAPVAPATPSSISSRASTTGAPGSGLGLGTQLKATIAPDGREISSETASKWASTASIPVTMEVSALSGENVEDVFNRLARMILTKIELGEIDPDDPMSGIQYGDIGGGRWEGGTSDGASVKSGFTGEEGGGRRRRGGRGRANNWGLGGVREWEEVFTLSGRRRRGCC